MKKGSKMTKKQRKNLSEAHKTSPACKKWLKELHKKSEGRHYSPQTEFKKGNPKPKNAYAFPKGHKINWKNGKCINNGYLFIFQPNHPFCKKSGYILNSHLIMEKYLNRYITNKEVVHHINKNKLDDRIENLMLFKNTNEHTKYHQELHRRSKLLSSLPSS